MRRERTVTVMMTVIMAVEVVDVADRDVVAEDVAVAVEDVVVVAEDVDVEVDVEAVDVEAEVTMTPTTVVANLPPGPAVPANAASIPSRPSKRRRNARCMEERHPEKAESTFVFKRMHQQSINN